MLVLGRRVGESIFVGDAIVRVIRLERGQVKLGITADNDIPVDREEVRRDKRRRLPLRKRRFAT